MIEYSRKQEVLGSSCGPGKNVTLKIIQTFCIDTEFKINFQHDKCWFQLYKVAKIKDLFSWFINIRVKGNPGKVKW